MNERTATRLAVGGAVLALALAIGAGILQYLTREVPVEPYGVRGFQGPLGIVLATLGMMIVRARPRNPVGWIFVLGGLISTVQGFNAAYVALSIRDFDGSLPFTTQGTWLSVWIWVFIVGPLTMLVPLIFPYESFERPLHRRLAVFDVAAMIAFAIVVSLTPGQSGEMPVGVTNPYGTDEVLHASLMSFAGPLFTIGIVASIVVLIRRFRRARGETRQQLKWLTFAGSIVAVALTLNLVAQGGGVSSSVYDRATAIATVLAFISLLVATGIAILKYGLYEVDVVINKTIVYALLAAFITVVYVGVVIGVGALVGSGANTALTVAATAIVALAVQPVRMRANRVANRLVFGERASPYEALSAFSSSLSQGVATEDTLPRLARLMTEATAAVSAGVWLVSGDELRPAGLWPPRALAPVPRDAPLGEHVFEVAHEDEILGYLSVEDSPAEPLSLSQEQLLRDLASQAGLLLRNVSLIEELRASRQRLVAAQDAERRRIERNLHDGAQQQLVALAVGLKLTRTMLDSDPAQAGTMLEQLQADATDALETLRDLARGIYPPLLAERGLVEALRSQAAKAALPVEVTGDGVGRYPMEVESAIYFCVLEALQNVAKYAQASSARVEVDAVPDRLSFAVHDDGVGFDPATARRGAGLTNMADRLDALGGRLEVRAAPGGGAVVGGSIDVAPRAADAPPSGPAAATATTGTD